MEQDQLYKRVEKKLQDKGPQNWDVLDTQVQLHIKMGTSVERIKEYQMDVYQRMIEYLK